MKYNAEGIRKCLLEFNFTHLFVNELGWANGRPNPISAVQGHTVREVAVLGGIPALLVTCGAELPDKEQRKSISRDLSKQFHEHLLIFVDDHNTRMLWFWPKRENGQTQIREHVFVSGQPGDLFLSKLAGLFVDLEEYDESGQISVLAAGTKLKEALDVSKVTKKFYAQFKERHVEFLSCIQGIDNEGDKRWYASVLLNRLMFVYFLQKKGFLHDGDVHYLKNHFCPDYFESFLKPLFFEGFAQPPEERSPATRALLCQIPYLNGGLFLPHAIEQRFPDICVADSAFHNVLELFESYSWNLNDVPGERDDELNPDVLGYIFEKYINDQKSAGAYYTPPEITQYLCERTIHDLLVQRVKVLRGGKLKSFSSVGEMLIDLDKDLCRNLLEELQTLRLVDPAVGSGAFLVAALKTLTDLYGALWGRAEVLHDEALKMQLIGDERRHASPFYAIRKRIVTGNLYGVDIMAEATEIARLRLFLSLVSSARTVEELEPLPNIDFNILPGNSLIGMLTCEEKDFLSGGLILKAEFDELAKKKDHLVGQYKTTTENGLGQLVALKNQANELRGALKTICDGVLWEEFISLKVGYEQVATSGKAQKKPLKPEHVREQLPFHWGFEFEEVMEQGGFDAVITNPPWEIWKPNAKEFFQEYSELVTKNKMTIKEFEKHQEKLLQDAEVAEAWCVYQSRFPHVSSYFRASSQYANQISIVNGKKAGTDINLYKLFVERCFRLMKPGGRCGIVIPSGIYTDLGAKRLREMLFEEAHVTGLFCFENKGIFEGVDSRFKFVLLTWSKGGSTTEFPAAFMRHDVNELRDFPGKDSLQISVDTVRRLSPDSLSVMEFKSERDVEIIEKMLKFPLLGEKLPDTWNVALSAEFHMTNDSKLFKTEPGPGRLPLYEGKMIWQFDAHYAKPRYWVDEKEGRANLLGRNQDVGQKLDYQGFRLGFRAIASSTNERTIVVGPLPKAVFCGNSLLVSKAQSLQEGLSSLEILFLQAVANSFIVDYYARMMVTANINMFYLYQLPIPRLTAADAAFKPIVTRAAQLICTTPEFHELAQAAGLSGHEAGVTDAAERARLRAELDALVAHLYGLDESDFQHILEAFPSVPVAEKQRALVAFGAGVRLKIHTR